MNETRGQGGAAQQKSSETAKNKSFFASPEFFACLVLLVAMVCRCLHAEEVHHALEYSLPEIDWTTVVQPVHRPLSVQPSPIGGSIDAFTPVPENGEKRTGQAADQRVKQRDHNRFQFHLANLLISLLSFFAGAIATMAWQCHESKRDSRNFPFPLKF